MNILKNCPVCGERYLMRADEVLYSCLNGHKWDVSNQLLDRAIGITVKAFGNKYDKGGKPYILHCLKVMYGVAQLGTKAMMTAVMHDLIEDTSWTANDLRYEHFPESVVNDVELLTRIEGEDYPIYIMKIRNSNRKISITIKMVDLKHNMRPDRLPVLDEKHLNRMKKYYTAYEYLTKSGLLDVYPNEC